jgi:two-component sensor histidine kinase
MILALAVHELATNAAKYGALSLVGGQLAIVWMVEAGDAAPMLRIVWQEHGGPPVAPPEHRGFGTKLIEFSLVRVLHAKVERTFEPGGVCCSITMALTPEIGSLTPPALPV